MICNLLDQGERDDTLQALSKLVVSLWLCVSAPVADFPSSRWLKIMTMTMFCGDVAQTTWQRVWDHEALMATRMRPAIAPLLDIFPWLLKLPNSWLPGKVVENSEAYYRDNHDFWQCILKDVEDQMVSN